MMMCEREREREREREGERRLGRITLSTNSVLCEATAEPEDIAEHLEFYTRWHKK
jgi:hypothetical protein